MIRLQKMKQFITSGILVLLLFFSCAVAAQMEERTISGQLLDSDTKEPIVFASLYLKGQGVGTTTNEEGRYIFHFESSPQAVVVISMIGYESIEKKVSDFEMELPLLLRAKTTQLNEVVVMAAKEKRLTAKQLVKKAYKEIENNYPTEPYILEGYIRDLQNEDGTYVEYLECAAKFYYQSYQVQRDPAVELVEVRSNYIAEKHPWNANQDRKNSIIDLVEDDLIRYDYGPIKGKNGWKYTVEGIVPFNGKYVYKIVGEDTPFQTAVLHIDTETFAFVRIELTRKAYNGASWMRRLTNGAQQMQYHLICEYREYKGKMYLKYQQEEDTWQIYDAQNPSALLFTKNPKKELFINKIISEGVPIYHFNKNLQSGTSIEGQAKEYNAQFWERYNAPQRTKAMSKIEGELKKTMPE